VQDDKRNFTRFLMLSRTPDAPSAGVSAKV